MLVKSEERKAAPLEGGAARKHELLVAGIATGVAGGLGMMIVLAIAAVVQDLSPLQPLVSIGESFRSGGEVGAGGQVLLGAVVHLATAAAFGIVIAGLIPRDLPTSCAMALGAGLALFAMGITMSNIVPWVNPRFRESAQVIGGSWVIAHVVFGAIAGLAAPLRRWRSWEASRGARATIPSRA